MQFLFFAQRVFCLQEQNEFPALQFACKYSLITNELGYCGKEKAFLAFEDFLSKPSEKKVPRIKKLLESFYSVDSYLKIIAEANHLEKFDSSVLEAYWLGNELLEKVSFSEIQKTIFGFEKFGLPKKIAEQKANGLPAGILPHHSMHVLHVNFITRKLKPLLKNLSNCLVSWAQVKGIEKKSGRIKAKGIELKILNGDFVLQEKKRLIENPFSLLPAKGDFVSVHWNNAIETLSKQKLKGLQKTTLKNLQLINCFGVKKAKI